MRMALYIMSIFSAQPLVFGSWGVSKFTILQGGTCITFHVQGFKFNGWVKVTYDEGADLFNVTFLSDAGKTVGGKKGIYLDGLVSVIDEYVEKTTDYGERVAAQYRQVVLI